MSCTKPMLMKVIDTRKFVIGDYLRYEKLGFKFNKDECKGYRLIPGNSRDMPLEDIDSWCRQEIIEIPCGKCIQCQLAKAKDWAVRCTHEASQYKYNYFLTLTYDDDHLVKGEFGDNATLVKDHFKQFLKALRKKLKRKLNHEGVRFIGCGEYNSEGSRMLNPHYHLILFNCPIPDLTVVFPTPDGSVIHKINKLGLPMFYSKFINDLWCDEDGNSRGWITIDDANFNTESYVSRYILKKQSGENYSVYQDKFGVVPPFLRMSNRPGIGYNSFDALKDDLIDDPSIIVSRPNKQPLVVGLPRYYKKHLFVYKPKLKKVFVAKAKASDRQAKVNRFFNDTTSNKQKEAIEKHSESVASVYSRNFE